MAIAASLAIVALLIVYAAGRPLGQRGDTRVVEPREPVPAPKSLESDTIPQTIARAPTPERRPEPPVKATRKDPPKPGTFAQLPEPPLQPGARVRLIVHLPPPVGGVNRMVTIARLAGNRNPRHRVIGIAFEREIPGLRELLERNSDAA